MDGFIGSPEEMKFYQDIIRRSLQITWRHKFLWWFGFFTLLWSTKGTEIETFFSHARLLATESLSPFQPSFWERAQWETLWQKILLVLPLGSTLPMVIVVVAFGFMILGAVVIGMMMLSQASLIHSFAHFEKNNSSSRKNTQLSFDGAVSAGAKHWIAVLVVNCIGKFLSFGLLAFIAISFYLVDVNVLVGLVVFFVIGAMSLVVALVTRYALHYVVLQNMSPVQALRAGWHLFMQNAGVTFELLIMMILAYIGTTITALIAAVSITFPLVFIAMISAVHFDSWVGLYVLYYLFIIVAMYCFLFASLLFSTWYSGSWTLLFLTLVKNPTRPLTHRFIRGKVQWSSPTRPLAPNRRKKVKV